MKKLFFVILLFITLTSNSQTTPKNDKMDEFVNKWIGKPYKFGGTSEKGIDCSALVQRFYKFVFDATIPRTCVKQFNFFEKLSISELVVGDAIFFTSKLSPSGWHVGIYLGNDLFFHSANVKDKIKISCLSEERYNKSFKGGGRLKKTFLH